LRADEEEFAMRWDDFRRSDNIEDVRGDDSGGGFGGGGMPMGGGGLGIGTILVLGLLGWALGIDPRILIGGADIIMGGGQGPAIEQSAPSQQRDASRPTTPPTDQSGDFIAAILGNTEDTWTAIFKENGQTYQAPKLRIFSGATRSACGPAQSAMGPFYCPLDKRIYIDTSFFRDLERRFRGCSGKACEFAQAYVISHEVGHHIQNLLGVLPRAQQMQQQVGNRAEANRIQVRVELQADCFAGVWAARSNQRWKFIEPGDVEAAMQTAAAIGDDRLQKQSQGTVVPDSFTHGSSAQRQRWFSIGLKEGKVSACNTFNAPNV
jgi:predicted metalloprotease